MRLRVMYPGRVCRGLITTRRPASASRPVSAKGQALVEFSLVFPVLFLLITNTVNFGVFIFDWITIADAARGAAQYWAIGSASPSSPTAPTATQVTNLVTNEVSSLIDKSTLVVRVCTNANSTISCTGSGSSTPPADPEPTNYTLTSVDVTYTFTPPISLFSFRGLGVYITLPPTTIHRRAIMRLQQ